MSQLSRILRTCPELPDGKPNPAPQLERERSVCSYKDEAGWLRGSFFLPPSEGTEYDGDGDRPRRGVSATPRASRPMRSSKGSSRPGVTWTDAFMRLINEGNDALDPTLQRTGYHGERNQVVLHHDINPGGTLRPGQLHLGEVIPDTVARFLACGRAGPRRRLPEAGVLLGITPAVRVPSRALRRAYGATGPGLRAPVVQPSAAGSTSTTSSSGAKAGSPCLPTSCACARSTTESSTKASSRSKATPKPATSRFLDARGRPIKPPDTRLARGPSASPSPPPSPSPTAAASALVPSTGTQCDTPDPRDGGEGLSPTRERQRITARGVRSEDRHRASRS